MCNEAINRSLVEELVEFPNVLKLNCCEYFPSCPRIGTQDMADERCLQANSDCEIAQHYAFHKLIQSEGVIEI